MRWGSPSVRRVQFVTAAGRKGRRRRWTLRSSRCPSAWSTWERPSKVAQRCSSSRRPCRTSPRCLRRLAGTPARVRSSLCLHEHLLHILTVCCAHILVFSDRHSFCIGAFALSFTFPLLVCSCASVVLTFRCAIILGAGCRASAHEGGNVFERLEFPVQIQAKQGGHRTHSRGCEAAGFHAFCLVPYLFPHFVSPVCVFSKVKERAQATGDLIDSVKTLQVLMPKTKPGKE